jgi:hypothetical protein
MSTSAEVPRSIAKMGAWSDPGSWLQSNSFLPFKEKEKKFSIKRRKSERAKNEIYLLHTTTPHNCSYCLPDPSTRLIRIKIGYVGGLNIGKSIYSQELLNFA